MQNLFYLAAVRLAFLLIGLLAVYAVPGSARAAQAPVDFARATDIAQAYFRANIGCGSFDGLIELPDRWVIEARVGYAGTRVEGYFIDKKTGVVTAPLRKAASSAGAAEVADPIPLRVPPYSAGDVPAARGTSPAAAER